MKQFYPLKKSKHMNSNIENSEDKKDRPRLLVVDDDKYIRRILAMGLSLEGFDVEQAADGLEAFEMLRNQRPDAITLDLMMPVMDGRSFIHRVRDELGSDVPIVVLTSVDRAEAMRDLAETGASAILHKPAEVHEIVKTLRELKLEV